MVQMEVVPFGLVTVGVVIRVMVGVVGVVGVVALVEEVTLVEEAVLVMVAALEEAEAPQSETAAKQCITYANSIVQ